MKRIVAGILISLACGACTDTIAPNTESGLAIWTNVFPSRVSLSDTAATIRIFVSERNPTWHSIVLPGGPPYVFTGDPANSKGIEESIRIADSTRAFVGPGVDFWGQHEYVIGPRSSRGTSYDMNLAAWFRSQPPRPGIYIVRGYFNGQEGKSATLRIVP